MTDEEFRDRMKVLMDQRCIGSLEAKQIVALEEMISDINAIETIDDVKTVLYRIVTKER